MVSGTTRPAPAHTEADPEIDAVLDRLKKLGAEHPAEAEAVKTWAHGEDRKLGGGDLRDVEWRAQVVEMLDELDADRSPNGTSDEIVQGEDIEVDAVETGDEVDL